MAPDQVAVHEAPYVRLFTVGGLTYKFTAFNGGPVSFLIAGGATAKKSYVPATNEWWDDDDADNHRLIDSGYFTNAAPVLKEVYNLILAWTRQERPYLFHFRATDAKKHRLYQRLVERHAGALELYAYYMSGREFYFVRKEQAR